MTTTASTNASRRRVLLDLLLIVGTLLISKNLLLQVDALWTYAGPISLLLSLCVAMFCLRQSGENWTSVGLKRPESIKKLVLWIVIAFFVTMVVGLLSESVVASLFSAPDEATQAIDARFVGRFDNLEGNLPVYLFWLAVGWIIGGFTEEVLFRGALFLRFEQLFTGAPFAVFLAILCQAFFFGQGHYYYQGIAGFVATGAIGVVSGLLYLFFKRNLLPLMLVHGLSNTIGLTLLYLGVAP
ncbi:MAG: CPBP family intramembrane glutamic endopeptidase [Parasphingorhabdus sp.]